MQRHRPSKTSSGPVPISTLELEATHFRWARAVGTVSLITGIEPQHVVSLRPPTEHENAQTLLIWSLTEVMGEPTERIAGWMNMSRQTIRSQLHAARLLAECSPTFQEWMDRLRESNRPSTIPPVHPLTAIAGGPHGYRHDSSPPKDGSDRSMDDTPNGPAPAQPVDR